MNISTIKVGTPADYAPFSYQNNTSGKYEGFDVELIQKIFLNLGVTIEFVKTTWVDLENELSINKFDMAVGGISLTKQRVLNFLTSPPTIYDGKSLLICKKHAGKINSLEDADNKMYTFIENRGGTNEKFVKEHIKNANVYFVDDNISIFEKLASGEFDIMVTDLSEALYREHSDSRLMVVQPIKLYTEPTGYGFIYNKNKDNLQSEVNEALLRYMKIDEFKILKNKYFNTDIDNVKKI